MQIHADLKQRYIIIKINYGSVMLAVREPQAPIHMLWHNWTIVMKEGRWQL